MSEPEYMLIGEPNAGKTSFCVQLIKRMQRSLGQLELVTAPEDLSLIAGPLKAMNEGLAPEHTERGTYGQLELSVKDKATGESVVLSWPDYGGEQVLEITRDRIVPSAWVQRVAASAGWILLIRLNEYSDQETLLSRPIGDILMPARGKAVAAKRKSGDQNNHIEDITKAETWPAQVRFIEFFQALLYVRLVERLSEGPPPLFIVLSCWDELGFAEHPKPEEVFAHRMPLLYDFIRSKWRQSAAAFYGLSAQGRPLRKDQPDADYARRGPEHFGYIVQPEGSESNDLSLIIADLMTASQK